MKKISKFDLGMIIAFVVIGAIGGGAWYYLSGQLASAQQDVTDAKTNYDKYAVVQNIVVSTASQKNLQDNIDLIKSQLDPLVASKLQPKDNKLSSIDKKDPVAWKSELDGEVVRLTDAAKLHGVKIPQNFYFSFSRYLNKNPDDQQTAILSKQLLAIEQMANILINAPVKNIVSIRRTYEEDGRAGGPGGFTPAPNNNGAEADHLAGYSTSAGGGIYTAYPFEITFDTDPEVLRKVIDDLVQCPYIFVVRTIVLQNSDGKSPLITDLDRIAGAPSPSVVDSPPGEVAATTSSQPPQFLFGNGTLRARVLVDLIEWNGVAVATTPVPNNSPGRGRPPVSGGNGPSAPGAN